MKTYYLKKKGAVDEESSFWAKAASPLFNERTVKEWLVSDRPANKPVSKVDARKRVEALFGA